MNSHTERYRSGHNEAVLKTVCPQGRKGSNPFLSAVIMGTAVNILQVVSQHEKIDTKFLLFGICIMNQLFWRSTQVVEETPLERVQVVNSGARVQIPPSPLAVARSQKT